MGRRTKHTFPVPHRSIISDIAITGILLIAVFTLLASRPQLSEAEVEKQVSGTVGQVVPIELEDTQTVPTLELSFAKAPREGWNLQLITENFGFGTDPDYFSYLARGQAHLLIDGQSRGRIYGNLHNVTGLTPGRHRIDVILESETFHVYMHEGHPVMASVTVDIPAEETEPPDVITSLKSR